MQVLHRSEFESNYSRIEIRYIYVLCEWLIPFESNYSRIEIDSYVERYSEMI